MKPLLLSLLILLLWAGQGAAHLGPRLIMAVVPSSDIALVELITFYLEEKTGVGTDLLSMDQLRGGEALRDRSVDFILQPSSPEQSAAGSLGFGETRLYYMDRIQNDLSFSTVLPALKKLTHRVAREGIDPVRAAIAAGESPRAAARLFLLRQGWI